MPRRIRPTAGQNHQCHPGSRDIRLEDVKVQACPSMVFRVVVRLPECMSHRKLYMQP